MTAKGELYIDEDCRDTFQEELNNWFGEEKWSLNASPFGDFWDLSEFPQFVEIDVLDDEDGETIIGRVEIESNFYIEEGMGGKYVEVEPKSIKLLEMNDKLKELVTKKVNQEQEIKQEVIDNLKGDRKLKCPFCNHDRFLRKETCYCDVWEREDDGTCDEDISGEHYEFFCAKCNKEIEELK